MEQVYERHFDLSNRTEPQVDLPVFSDRASIRPRIESSIRRSFELLDNPMLLIYVHPHLATKDRMPVPGYWTAIPMYDRTEFALPGEQHKVEYLD